MDKGGKEKQVKLVVDASVAAKWIIPGVPWEEEANTLKRVIVSGQVETYAPILLTYELASVLLKAVRKGVLKTVDGIEALKAVGSLGIDLAPVLWEEVAEIFEVADSTSLTIYDATYLWLSKKLNVPLVTADEKLCKKGERIAKIISLQDLKI